MVELIGKINWEKGPGSFFFRYTCRIVTEVAKKRCTGNPICPANFTITKLVYMFSYRVFRTSFHPRRQRVVTPQYKVPKQEPLCQYQQLFFPRKPAIKIYIGFPSDNVMLEMDQHLALSTIMGQVSASSVLFQKLLASDSLTNTYTGSLCSSKMAY